MKFVDKVLVKVQAGDGGNGAVSFRHEKFVDRGGPDGGDGGNGGNVVLVASNNQNTLAKYRHSKTIKAESGAPGTKRNRHGKSGKDISVPVPVGTQAVTNSGKILADLTREGDEAILASGGKGGFGNAHFVSSRRQAPRIAEKGEKGEQFEVLLELKLIADVGVVGLPNAGKSTLLSTISNARPEVADYPFTTLVPNLGVVDIGGDTSILFADIPGLIEGASHGKGLGDEFLRHAERTSVLVHLVDVYNDDVAGAYQTIQNELSEYKVDLSKKPQIIALNKIDGVDEETVKSKIKELKSAVKRGTKVFTISAKSKEGLDKLLYEVKNQVQKQVHKQKQAKKAEIPVIKLQAKDSDWQVTTKKNKYIVTGTKIEKFAARTDVNNPQGVERIRDIMNKMGITHYLIKMGIQAGQKVVIGEDNKLTIEF